MSEVGVRGHLRVQRIRGQGLMGLRVGQEVTLVPREDKRSTWTAGKLEFIL